MDPVHRVRTAVAAGSAAFHSDRMLSGANSLPPGVEHDLRDWTASFALRERYARYRRVELPLRIRRGALYAVVLDDLDVQYVVRAQLPPQLRRRANR